MCIGAGIIPKLSGYSNNVLNPNNKKLLIKSEDTDWWPMVYHDSANTRWSTSKTSDKNSIKWTGMNYKRLAGGRVKQLYPCKFRPPCVVCVTKYYIVFVLNVNLLTGGKSITIILV